MAMNKDLKKKLNLNSYEWWRNHRRFVTLGVFLALFAAYLRDPSMKDFKVNDICGRLSADLITGEDASKQLRLGNKRIDGIDGDKVKITNHYYHAKYYCQGYKKGNVGLGF
tara:strand:+ start:4796 stop:5128 length:333 start_codon:yes stop_codon:yes gene_type:complete